MLTKIVLFYRDFRGFSGGNLKVWNYFIHVKHAKSFTSRIYFSPETLWDESNPWMKFKDSIQPVWEKAHILFLAGLDWLMLSGEQRDDSKRPVINLIQGFRHSYNTDKRYTFLHHKAIRICVSEEVRIALEETKRCNGPLLTIPNGIDRNEFPALIPEQNKIYDILIAGLKQPVLACELREALEPTRRNIKLLNNFILRDKYLDEITNAKITLFLPHEQEGFYLPALEGMALETFVICPDCVGNRSFCLDRYNCLRPHYTMNSLLDSIQVALSMSTQDREIILSNAREIVARHDLMAERQAFLQLLDNIDQIW